MNHIKVNGFFANWMIQYNRSPDDQTKFHSFHSWFLLFADQRSVPWCNWGPGSCVQVHWLFSSLNRSGRRKSARFLGHPSKTFFHLLSRWLSHNIRHIRTNSIIFASTVVLNLPLLNRISINLLPMFRFFTSNSLYLMVINSYCKYLFSISHDGSMVLPYMVTWIPSIYPSHVSIYIYQHHGSVMAMFSHG